MTAKYKQGDVLTGKVTGIQPYGAFVALDEETQGLVHISEIKHGFVKDINEVLSVGDEVKVKVLQVNEEEGKISLSIRVLQEEPPAEAAGKPRARRQGSVKLDEVDREGFNTLKDKLQEWIKKSERDDLIKK
ncbi:S1 domain-containing post-transcriptional regulator GSP13 [Siminovitchia fortis]|uniref:General stress protein 13 n=1 Tax=Siminovitchia fortis TaxID=254758 RepID=A0A443IME0_9BACI|nr:S1 domain-containing post-transcriptional regulator GSP13 [Siminovitchia fortis]RWR06333.1 general stress protein 13 [Siminovitchia fortis]WHY82161.1 S1 domain-containing post-transcriptional regulator GSP13 [Siminovitchia fortis]